MIIIFVSDLINTRCRGHRNFDFLDVYLDDDNRLFIDPCMIEGADDPWSLQASAIMHTYFDCMFEGFRDGTIRAGSLLQHAGEQNATKLGYGNGENGKGKTEEGLWDSLKDLSILVHDIPTISKAQDIPVLVQGFAEDCMSDLLTNILHEPLHAFTAEQMSRWGCPSQADKTFWTFNAEARIWRKITRPSWFYNGKELLLVPKWIVRRNYLFKAHQYLYGVIIERIRSANEWHDLKKVDIWSNLSREQDHWEYEKVISYTKEHPDALAEYHDRIPRYYRRANGCMTDVDLDDAIYGHRIDEIA